MHLHQPGHRRGRIEWSQHAIEEFRQMIKEGSHVYARTTAESNTVELISYDPVAKKWFSFYEHFVKHLNTSDDQEQTN